MGWKHVDVWILGRICGPQDHVFRKPKGMTEGERKGAFVEGVYVYLGDTLKDLRYIALQTWKEPPIRAADK